jgi:hypothetical protein
MADFFIWNRPESQERGAIERFLREVDERVDRVPEREAGARLGAGIARSEAFGDVQRPMMPEIQAGEQGER